MQRTARLCPRRIRFSKLELLELQAMESLRLTHDEWYALDASERSRWVTYFYAKQYYAGRICESLKVKGKYNEFTLGAVGIIKMLAGNYA